MNNIERGTKVRACLTRFVYKFKQEPLASLLGDQALRDNAISRCTASLAGGDWFHVLDSLPPLPAKIPVQPLEMSLYMLRLFRNQYSRLIFGSKPFFTPDKRAIASEHWFPNPDANWVHQSKLSSKVARVTATFSPGKKPLLIATPSDITVLRTRKIRIYPSPQQRTILRRWQQANIHAYNRVLDYLNDNKCWKMCKSPKMLYNLVNKINLPPQEVDTPTVVLRSAIDDLCTGYKAAVSNLKRGNVAGFEFSPRSPDKTTSFGIQRSSGKLVYSSDSIWPSLSLYPQALGGPISITKHRLFKLFPNYEICHDCKLLFSRGRWYLLLPVDLDTYTRRERVRGAVALDPGEVKFQTAYSSRCIIEAKTDREFINRINRKLDILQARRKRRRIRKQAYNRATSRLRYKLEEAVRHMHIMLSNVLTQFDQIYIPEFKIKGMVGGRKLTRPVKRRMYALSHYKFKQRLIAQAERTDCVVHICDESLTSQTCGGCGVLGAAGIVDRVFDCGSCSFMADRDVNAARNIYLKNHIF